MESVLGPQVRIFDQVAQVYDQHVPFFATFGSRLAAWAGIRSGDRVLDLACGRGAVAAPARDECGPSGVVVAVDASTAMVAAAQPNLPGVKLAVMDARQLAFSDGLFDVVTCGFALHFVADLPRVLAEVRRVLRPGGKLAWSEAAPADDRGRWRFYADLVARYEPLADPAQRIHTTPEPVDQIATQVGFGDIDYAHEQVHLPLADSEAFWAWHRSHGAHALWLALPDAAREAFRRDLFAGLTHMHAAGGIVLDRGARFTSAVRQP
jgi:ubiquinone/menaquinone biosynthesis C-methylase UbiE